MFNFNRKHKIKVECIDDELVRKLLREIQAMATLADTINDTNAKVTDIQSKVVGLVTAVAALPTTAGAGGLSAADEATLNNINSTAQAVLAALTPTPAPAA